MNRSSKLTNLMHCISLKVPSQNILTIMTGTEILFLSKGKGLFRQIPIAYTSRQIN